MKLRQKIAIGLCAFYLLSVIGIALNLHFCSDELSSVNFTEKASCKVCKSADSNKIVKNDSSCKDSKVEAKVANKDESSAETQVPKHYGVAALFAPVIAEFLQDLLPGLFSKIRN